MRRTYTEAINSIRNGIIFVLPEWEKEGDGITVKEIANKTGYPEDFCQRFLKKSRKNIESISCGNNPVVSNKNFQNNSN